MNEQTQVKQLYRGTSLIFISLAGCGQKGSMKDKRESKANLSRTRDSNRALGSLLLDIRNLNCVLGYYLAKFGDAMAIVIPAGYIFILCEISQFRPSRSEK